MPVKNSQHLINIIPKCFLILVITKILYGHYASHVCKDATKLYRLKNTHTTLVIEGNHSPNDQPLLEYAKNKAGHNFH